MAVACAQYIVTEEDATMAFDDREVSEVDEHAPKVEGQGRPMCDARVSGHAPYTSD